MDSKKISEEAENINKVADNCFMSHQLFAAREIIAQKLDEEPTVKKKFQEKIWLIYNCKDNCTQHEAYIELEYDDSGYSKTESSARVFVSIDKIDPILSNSAHSYALRLTIVFSKADAELPYNGGYTDKKCSRFIISHELGHSILHLDSLIEKAVGSNLSAVSNNDDGQRESEADAFADILSDLRDVHLLGKGYEFNIKNIRESTLEANRLEEIAEEAKEVSKRADMLTMSHVAFAVSSILNKNLVKTKSKETINIYLTAKNSKGVEDMVIINCYKRRHKENLYIFELRLDNQRDKKPKGSSMDKEVCKAIGCIYFYFPQMKEMLDKEDGKNASRSIPKNAFKILCDIGMGKDKNYINTFAEDILKKRKESLRSKKNDMEKDNDLKKRLKNNNL